jgi:DNA-binding helix-hairpin-helix protein with protein kinase domain
VTDRTQWPDGSDIEVREISLASDIGRGGQGRVIRVVGMERRIVYKEYLRPDPDAEALQALVSLPGELSANDRQLLDQQAAWPLARVFRDGNLTGFLMPEIPERFFAPNAAGSPRLRELQYLVYEPKPLWGEIVPDDVDIRTRLSIASQCAQMVAMLHAHSLVVGDISMRNILWEPGPPPGIYLIDCDGIRRRGWRSVLPQPVTPDWDDPMMPRSGSDRDTDQYKIALLVGRVLCRRPYLRPTEDLELLPGVPARVATELRALWLLAGRPHGQRPAVQDWLTALSADDRIPELTA